MSVSNFPHIIFLTIILLASVFQAEAQELNCNVEINTDQVQGNESLYESLQESINDYMNTTKFSNANFSPNEKIDCRMFFTIREYTDDIIKCDLQIQATRPVYNAAYTTTVLNFKDSKIEFAYTQNQPLVFSETTMESNLTAILNYYAYLILALDFDTFSPNGGQPYFDRMQTIVQLAQSSGEIGWKSFEDNRNRAAVLAAFTEGSGQSMRDLLYQYHRRGLDEMVIGPDKGRATITEALSNLTKIHDTSPMSVSLSMWRDAKLDEIVNIYSKGSQTERDEVWKLLSDIFPAEQTRLDKIKNPPEY